jgi:hypothetical protein
MFLLLLLLIEAAAAGGDCGGKAGGGSLLAMCQKTENGMPKKEKRVVQRERERERERDNGGRRKTTNGEGTNKGGIDQKQAALLFGVWTLGRVDDALPSKFFNHVGGCHLGSLNSH